MLAAAERNPSPGLIAGPPTDARLCGRVSVDRYHLAERDCRTDGLLFMYQRFIVDITIGIIRLKQAFDGRVSGRISLFGAVRRKNKMIGRKT